MVDLPRARRLGFGLAQERLDLRPALDRDAVDPGAPEPARPSQFGQFAVMRGDVADHPAGIDDEGYVRRGRDQLRRDVRADLAERLGRCLERAHG